jgi:hypothetical protein
VNPIQQGGTDFDVALPLPVSFGCGSGPSDLPAENYSAIGEDAEAGWVESRFRIHLGIFNRNIEYRRMNYPAASCGASEFGRQDLFFCVTPESFYRGSSLNFAWIPAKGMRE